MGRSVQLCFATAAVALAISAPVNGRDLQGVAAGAQGNWERPHGATCGFLTDFSVSTCSAAADASAAKGLWGGTTAAASAACGTTSTATAVAAAAISNCSLAIDWATTAGQSAAALSVASNDSDDEDEVAYAAALAASGAAAAALRAVKTIGNCSGETEAASASFAQIIDKNCLAAVNASSKAQGMKSAATATAATSCFSAVAIGAAAKGDCSTAAAAATAAATSNQTASAAAIAATGRGNISANADAKGSRRLLWGKGWIPASKWYPVGGWHLVGSGGSGGWQPAHPICWTNDNDAAASVVTVAQDAATSAAVAIKECGKGAYEVSVAVAGALAGRK